jgi:hypothetical protein
MKTRKGKSEKKAKDVNKLAGVKLKATALQRVTLLRAITSDSK